MLSFHMLSSHSALNATKNNKHETGLHFAVGLSRGYRDGRELAERTQCASPHFSFSTFFDHLPDFVTRFH